MSTNKEPWLLRRPFFVVGSLLLATLFGILAYWLYSVANKGSDFIAKLGEFALQISILVLAGAAIKEFVEWRTTAKAEYIRKQELREEFLQRVREAHVKVVCSRDLMRAHSSAKSWSEQSRILMQLIAELEEISEDLQASPDLFKQQEDIIAGIEGMITYLNRCRNEYIENHKFVDADYKAKKSLTDTIEERNMAWVRDFMNGTDTFETEYAVQLRKAKIPMRRAVFGPNAANKALVPTL